MEILDQEKKYEDKDTNQDKRIEAKNVEPTEAGTEVDYIAAIKAIKESSVPREEFDKLKKQNKQLLDAYVNGDPINVDAAKKQINVDEIRKRLFTESSNRSNLDYVKDALTLRQALIERGQLDPFVPRGKQIKTTREDYECADRVARVLQECVDDAKDDPEAFTNLLRSRIM